MHTYDVQSRVVFTSDSELQKVGLLNSSYAIDQADFVPINPKHDRSETAA